MKSTMAPAGVWQVKTPEESIKGIFPPDNSERSGWYRISPLEPTSTGPSFINRGPLILSATYL
jgi:hypothetical protein